MKSTSSFFISRYFSLAISLFCLLVLGAIFVLTSLDDASPVLLLVIFVLQYGLVFGIINGLFVFFEKIKRLFFAHLPLKDSLTVKKKTRLVAFLSLMPIIALAIQSIKPIGFYEIVLILIITIFGTMFVYKK